MNVLLLGATGFIGRYVAQALHAQGHTVVNLPTPQGQRMDMARMTGVADWLPCLAGVDAVVNAVGVLRERPGQPIAQVHTAAPVALFPGCGGCCRYPPWGWTLAAPPTPAPSEMPMPPCWR